MSNLFSFRFLLLFIFAFSVSLAKEGIKNVNVERKIDLTTQFARQTLTLEVKNEGSSQVKNYQLAFHEKNAQHLAFLEVKDQKGNKLQITQEKEDKKGSISSVTLLTGLNAQETTKLTVKAVFTNALSPFPKAITQDENQLVLFLDNHFFYSPYETVSQKTIVKLASASVENNSEQPPTSVKGDTITYGPYEDVPAFSNSEMRIHFANNKPFVSATHVRKEIEVSHWGNVAVEESYDLEHTGAKLKGQFSRLDYQRKRGASNVVALLEQVLPASASDVYYRDEIGNISTSHVREEENNGVHMDLVPRFPLFGGWKIGFYFGYNLPSENYLFTSQADSSLYVLNISFASAFDQVEIDDLLVRVILPEGSSDIEFYTPFPVDSEGHELDFTYLDTTGRPVLVIRKSNVVPEHNQYFQVAYRFSQAGLLKEPFLLIGAFFLSFVFLLVARRIPLQFGDVKVKAPGAEEIEQLMLRFKEIYELKSELHQKFEEAVKNYVSSKDASKYAQDKKSFDVSANQLEKELETVAKEITKFSADQGKKADELYAKDVNRTATFKELAENDVRFKVQKVIAKKEYEKTKESKEAIYSRLSADIESATDDENL